MCVTLPFAIKPGVEELLVVSSISEEPNIERQLDELVQVMCRQMSIRRTWPRAGKIERKLLEAGQGNSVSM